MTVRTVIADDEPLARERIRRFVSEDTDLELAEECRNGKEVLQVLRTSEVDLLLLDIQMPGLDGFEVVKEMKQLPLPMIVFVTAHDHYAIQAFDVHALDYLLKPIESARFHEAIKRVKDRRQMELALATQDRFAFALTVLESLATAESSPSIRFVVRSGAKDLFVNVNDVTWIEAADYYVCLHVGEKKHMLRESIKKLEGGFFGSVIEPEEWRKFVHGWHGASQDVASDKPTSM